MSDEIEVGSQTDTTVEAPQQDAETEALYSSFGVKPAVEKKEIEFPDINQEQQEEEDIEGPPAIEDTTTQPKTHKFKHNKEEVEVDISTDEKLTDHLQRSLALDKVRDQAKQHQSDLDRAAKLLGYSDHAELTANFDKIEQERVQKQADQFEELKQQVIDELVNAGIDEQAARQYADNNPLVQQAKAAIEQLQQAEASKQTEAANNARQAGWNELFKEYPQLSESAKEDGTADWLTPDMDRRIKAGYEPIDAYRLAHAGTIEAQTKKAAEQKAIKAVQLGSRGHAEGQAPAADQVVLSAAQLALAEEFGVSPKEVERQQQLLKNRR